VIRGIAALALASAGLAAPATTDTTAPEFHSVTFSRTVATVAGLQTELLSVSVHLTDDESGVEVHPYVAGFEGYSPSIRVGREWINLTLGSGTPQDGVWTGGVAITSNWASGTYQPESLIAYDATGNELTVDPRTTGDVPSIAVTASNKPKLTLTFAPSPATVDAALTRVVKVVDGAGQPLPGAPIAFGADNECAESPSRYPEGRTNAAGEYRSTLPAGNTYSYGHCAWISSDNVPNQWPTTIAGTYQFPAYRWSVTAKPASSSVPAGTNVAVTGTLAPWSYGTELQLQRLYADNTWRTVNRGKTDSDSRFRILATPPGVATYSYRVLAPASGADRPQGISPVFTIRGR
jgi:hypothetical protein